MRRLFALVVMFFASLAPAGLAQEHEHGSAQPGAPPQHEKPADDKSMDMQHGAMMRPLGISDRARGPGPPGNRTARRCARITSAPAAG